jgi:calcium-dependent protein kinase
VTKAASIDPFQKGKTYLKSGSTFERPTANSFKIVKTGSFVKKYKIGKQIGEGSYGTVHVCEEIVSGAERSVKFIKREKNHNDDEQNKISGEISILSSLDHPNIAGFHEVINETTRHCLVSEYCKGGDLMESLDKYENFKEEDAGKIIKRLLSAIYYCHEKGIIHRDLKPENLMFEGDNCPDNIKVIDFGESLFTTVKKMV